MTRPSRRTAAFLALAAGVLVVAGLDDGSWVRVGPGPVLDVAETASVTDPVPGDPDRSGTVSFPTVLAEPVNHFEAAWCAVTTRCEVVPREPATPAGSNPVLDSIEFADHAATWYAARRVPGYADGAGWPDAPGTLSHLGNVRGPSAGLAVAVYLLDLRTPGDLTAGHDVAATGTLDATGAVGQVGGVPHKAAAAAAAGVDVLFVPTGSGDEASRGGGADALVVVEVDVLGDAVTWLCDHGGTGPLCRP